MTGGGPAGAHAQNDADDRHDTGDHLGAQQLHKAAAAGDIGKAQDPAGDTGTKNGAHDDTDGLPHFHHTGVDEAHHHDGGGRGGLDHGGHAGSQQNMPNRNRAIPPSSDITSEMPICASPPIIYRDEYYQYTGQTDICRQVEPQKNVKFSEGF